MGVSIVSVIPLFLQNNKILKDTQLAFTQKKMNVDKTMEL